MDAGASVVDNETKDILLNFENAISGSGDDLIWLNEADNIIYAGDGEDTVWGSQGRDYIDGGGDVDTANYSLLDRGLYFDMNDRDVYELNGTSKGEHKDVLAGFQNITATNYADVIRSANFNSSGRPRHETIYGGDGDDTIYASLGDDVYDGGKGNDLYVIDFNRLQNSQGTYSDIRIDDSDGKFAIQFIGLAPSEINLLETGGGDAGASYRIQEIPILSRFSGDLGLTTFSQAFFSQPHFRSDGLNPEYITYFDYANSQILDYDSGYFALANGTRNTLGESFASISFAESIMALLASSVDTALQEGKLSIDTQNHIWSFNLDLSATDTSNNEEPDSVIGGDEADTITGNSTNDTIWGNGGNDVVSSADGDDQLYGGNGNDSLNGGEGNDTVAGDAGNDLVWGDGGNDTVGGGDGNDTVYGGDGADFVTGDTGNDYVLGNLGDDSIFGFTGDDLLFGQAGDDLLQGEGGNDYVDGGDGNDGIYGGDGNDVLYGQEGNDWLDGGSGVDYLNGGAGADGLTGGDGMDIFLFTDVSDSVLWSGDWIYDFASSIDKLDVSAIATGISVIDGASFSGIGISEWRYYEVGGNTVHHLDANGDAVADFEIVIVGQAAVTLNDFLYN